MFFETSFVNMGNSLTKRESSNKMEKIQRSLRNLTDDEKLKIIKFLLEKDDECDSIKDYHYLNEIFKKKTF